jgi:hypothetical protein
VDYGVTFLKINLVQLRQRLELQPETISDFVLAAEQRYWEGIELAAAGRSGAGIYLLGYCAEIYLKVASFRFDGARSVDLIAPRLIPARTWMNGQPARTPHEGYHSLLFWLNYLRARRASAGRSLEGNLNGRLIHHVNRLYLSWWVEMRYRPDSAKCEDVQRVLNDVTWLKDHQNALWS